MVVLPLLSVVLPGSTVHWNTYTPCTASCKHVCGTKNGNCRMCMSKNTQHEEMIWHNSSAQQIQPTQQQHMMCVFGSGKGGDIRLVGKGFCVGCTSITTNETSITAKHTCTHMHNQMHKQVVPHKDRQQYIVQQHTKINNIEHNTTQHTKKQTTKHGTIHITIHSTTHTCFPRFRSPIVIPHSTWLLSRTKVDYCFPPHRAMQCWCTIDTHILLVPIGTQILLAHIYYTSLMPVIYVMTNM